MNEKVWKDFEKSGKVTDYLRYRGIENIGGFTNASDNSERNSDQGAKRGGAGQVY
ncbi:MAG: hypothetical protein Q4F95_12035 [Oscillospiraceae bacterium]|nr:hypothetical protein [Oscillospiraceae bacterium]